MRYALIMAGGSGTRLWPMSRAELPKQLIPFIHGKSLLQVAYDRFGDLVPNERRFVCAGERHREIILSMTPDLKDARFLGEPEGRDTLNAVGFAAAVLHAQDPEAVIGVFTADHLIQPAERFREIVEQGYALVDSSPETLVTFGITPNEPATGYGYLQLGEPLGDARRVIEFREKPPQELAEDYVRQGPDRYLWNSGMFVWRAETLLDCIRRYEPETATGLKAIADAWDASDRVRVVSEVFPTLKKISVDFAVMEPASRDDLVQVAALPMDLEWLDVGSWPSFAETCPTDEAGNSLGLANHLLLDSSDCLVVSDQPGCLIATIGCEGLVVIQTERATLICRKEESQRIKELQQLVDERFGGRYT